VRLGMYRAILRYIGPQALTTIGKAVTGSAVLLAIVIYLYGTSTGAVVPRSLVIIYWLLCLLFIGGLRLMIRRYFNQAQFGRRSIPLLPRNAAGRGDQRTPVVIYGAGAAGNQLLSALRNGREKLPV